MKKNIAEQLLKCLLDLDNPFNKATELTFQIEDEQEAQAIRRIMGEITGKVYVDIMMPIIKQYPDLERKYREALFPGFSESR